MKNLIFKLAINFLTIHYQGKKNKDIVFKLLILLIHFKHKS